MPASHQLPQPCFSHPSNPPPHLTARLVGGRTPSSGGVPPTMLLHEGMDHIGFGAFHWRLLFICGLGFMADAMWEEVTPLLMPQVRHTQSDPLQRKPTYPPTLHYRLNWCGAAVLVPSCWVPSSPHSLLAWVSESPPSTQATTGAPTNLSPHTLLPTSCGLLWLGLAL